MVARGIANGRHGRGAGVRNPKVRRGGAGDPADVKSVGLAGSVPGRELAGWLAADPSRHSPSAAPTFSHVKFRFLSLAGQPEAGARRDLEEKRLGEREKTGPVRSRVCLTTVSRRLKRRSQRRQATAYREQLFRTGSTLHPGAGCKAREEYFISVCENRGFCTPNHEIGRRGVIRGQVPLRRETSRSDRGLKRSSRASARPAEPSDSSDLLLPEAGHPQMGLIGRVNSVPYPVVGIMGLVRLN